MTSPGWRSQRVLVARPADGGGTSPTVVASDDRIAAVTGRAEKKAGKPQDLHAHFIERCLRSRHAMWRSGTVPQSFHARAARAARTPVSTPDMVEPRHPSTQPAERTAGRFHSRGWARLRFVLSWATAVALVGIGLPRVVHISWHGVLPVLTSLPWPAVAALVVLWLLGLVVHSFVLTAAAPDLTPPARPDAQRHRQRRGQRGAPRRCRRRRAQPPDDAAWGIDARTFTGFTFLTNLWDVGAKLLLPVVAVVALARAGEAVTPPLRLGSLIGGLGLHRARGPRRDAAAQPPGAILLGHGRRNPGPAPSRRLVTAASPTPCRLAARDPPRVRRPGRQRLGADVAGHQRLRRAAGHAARALPAADRRRQHLAGGARRVRGRAAAHHRAAHPRAASASPTSAWSGCCSPSGGDPTGVTAAAVLYRVFIFAIEIPVGGGALGLWLLGQHARVPPPRAVPAVAGGTAAGSRTSPTSSCRAWAASRPTSTTWSATSAPPASTRTCSPRPQGAGRRPGVGAPAAGQPKPAAPSRDYDVVHVHLSMLSAYGIGVARAATAAGVPTLITVHSMWAGAGGDRPAGRPRRPAPLARRLVRGQRRRRRTSSTGPSGGTEVAVLPNAIDVARRGGDPPHRRTPAGPDGEPGVDRSPS